MGSILARTLLETNQEVPDFLQLYLPQGMTQENLKFETESDFDPNDIGGAADFGGQASGGGGWGAEESGAGDNPTSGDSWGANTGSGQGGDSWDPTSAPTATVGAW